MSNTGALLLPRSRLRGVSDMVSRPGKGGGRPVYDLLLRSDSPLDPSELSLLFASARVRSHPMAVKVSVLQRQRNEACHVEGRDGNLVLCTTWWRAHRSQISIQSAARE